MGKPYNYFRDYDPSIGRYTTSDPIGLGGGHNRFSYVEGNPARYADPLGLVRWEGKFFTIGGAIGAGVSKWIFNLSSECLPGASQRLKVKVEANTASLSSPRLSLIEAGGKISLEDPFTVPFEGALAGNFKAIGAAAAWGLGLSIGYVELGAARSEISILPNLIGGIGFSAGVEGGSATVVSAEWIPCSCDD